MQSHWFQSFLQRSPPPASSDPTCPKNGDAPTRVFFFFLASTLLLLSMYGWIYPSSWCHLPEWTTTMTATTTKGHSRRGSLPSCFKMLRLVKEHQIFGRFYAGLVVTPQCGGLIISKSWFSNQPSEPENFTCSLCQGYYCESQNGPKYKALLLGALEYWCWPKVKDIGISRYAII